MPRYGMTRRDALARIAASLAGAWLLDAGAVHPRPTAAMAASTGWTDGDYWAFADRIQPLLDDLWSEQRRYYRAGGGGETSFNANMLFTHAAAARFGHRGACRQDDRARKLARRLCEAPPWRPGAIAAALPAAPLCPEPGARISADQTHPWGWGYGMEALTAQHVVIDTAVVRGLAQAWLARNELALPEETATAILDRVRRCAYSTFYRFPALRLNQINWPVEIYAWAATILGDSQLMRLDCRQQLSRFADALTRRVPPFRSPFTGPGYRFHYLPQQPEHKPTNIDSAEYATIVCGVLQFYEQARRAGMRELTPAQLRQMRAWVERVLCGYWTHGGYLNWDTGMTFRRWHQGKKLGLCQAALLAIASAPRFQPTPAHGRWAKYLFDRGLAFFARLVDESDAVPPAVMFGVTRTPGSVGDAWLTASRMQANAAQAVALGLGRMRSEVAPPLYAYDPDVGRLAVTTPAYNTAILAVDADRLPYGGMELARLYDGDQRVVANIGGRGDAAFGVVLIEHATGLRIDSQRGRPRPSLRTPPLRLLRAPRGAVRHPVAYPRRAYAGPFRRLEAAGVTRSRAAIIHTRHAFHADHVETRWTVSPRAPRGRYTLRLRFPSWGPSAAVYAVLADGRRVRIGDRGRELGDVRWFHIAGEETGYVVVPAGRLGGRARLLRPRPQAADPRPGPTLALELLTARRLRRMRATVRIAPAATTDEAARVAARLSA
jgi:hypothetical protein